MAKYTKLGRPSKYKKQFCEDVIEYGKQGLSKAQMRARMGISFFAWHEWLTPSNPRYKLAFHTAVKEAEDASRAWWEDQAMAHLSDERAKGGEGRHTNATMFIFQMCNRFSKHYKRNDSEANDDEKQTNPNININIHKDKLHE